MSPVVKGILEEAAESFGVTIPEILGKCRRKSKMAARRYVARELRALSWSLDEIGDLLRRDHTTILWYLRGPRQRV